MIKLIFKCIIFLLALQSAMDSLRKEKIMEGSIKINYQAVQQKVLVAIPARKIVTGIFDFAIQSMRSTNDGENALSFLTEQSGVQESPVYKRDSCIRRNDILYSKSIAIKY